MGQTYFVTGAQGCIGAWTVKALVERGDVPVVFDLSDDARRLRLVIDDEQLTAVRFVTGDVTDLDALRRALDDCGARRIIHLAGLQVPFCAADPPKGARVNVVGTMNVFEAALAAGIERVVYASSAAVYGPDEGRGALGEDEAAHPTTHYGVYKRANEENARVYHADTGISSAGLRPLTVYGVARDQGMTSDLTRAAKACVLDRPFTIRFGGATDALYAADAAAAFIACADRAPEGAHVFNLHGDCVEVTRFVELITANLEGEERCRVTIDGPPLPVASHMDDGAIQRLVGDLVDTPLEAGVRETMERFRNLRERGLLDARDLEA
ncbi:MAG: NAD-dependent epimerase/dehydratase family protein [Planctomycetota bacterium]|jgi:nucleoside-diphosphate-sugar epimerase|nr:NAD-dependent epimerase/dehydratase family protein [Planctomycetota bacterium]MDP6762252.1 NAD-dependent epimerase/dehydratase family protein [Planctomycetota bacterium]MDP6989353.1 NAD-dependent epimerase/dehydratase family protein [Planctomycetota bacterium]